MKKNGLLLSALLLVAGTTFGQDYQFKKMNFAPIKGAPSLTQPTFLTDVSGNPITVGKRGHALPTLYDWNKDGLTDLLVGEFGNGKDAYLMIYENVGTATAPRFSDKPYYAKDKEGNLMFMEVSWCLGFYPQVVDIDGDKIVDIVSGTYAGYIHYYKGTKKGFMPQQEIPQVTKVSDHKNFFEVTFTSATFGDINDDGLLDCFVGGVKGLRVMYNQGTAKKPLFGRRVPIYQTDGEQVAVWDLSDAQIMERSKKQFNDMTAPDNKAYMLFYDWDGDGVEDLITTCSYLTPQAPVVAFHKGVKKNGEYRFEKRIPLFEAENGGKAFPGYMIVPFIGDINADGIPDLLLGVSIAVDLKTEKIDLKSAESYSLDGETKNKGYVVVLYGQKRY